ncbi:MAG TPA: hypothetical protein VKS60_19540 [Stellaceae bacterium]|nr:hypothetical protein [Stellaceae bacterium]
MARKIVDAAVIIPDAGPVLTLARIDRLDLFETFSALIHIVDQVQYEITKAANDPDGKVGAWLHRMGNRITIVETLVGFGFRIKLERGETPRGGNLGEIAVDEYATELALRGAPGFVPLVLFEDPDVLETRVARLARVHLLNTAAWIRALADEGIIPDGAALLDAINAQRKSPLMPIERPGRTKPGALAMVAEAKR